ncbi:MAG: hypothetical protein U9R54_06840 [Bacteroidota bacterium]|nr:hypothetical protein [Bacteroidota bacterium]
MKIEDVVHSINGVVVSGTEFLSKSLDKGFASDLMSDVLTLDDDNVILITGLSNTQVVRTAEMSDIPCVVVARNKKVTQQMIDLANDCEIVLIKSSCSVYKVVGELYNKGIKPIF